MSRFEFNTVLVSIVLAFAISEILTAWGRLIRHRHDVRAPGLYVLATSWVLAAIVVHWLGLWAYRDVPFARIGDTLLILLPALVIALVCFVWVPEPGDAAGRAAGAEKIDLESHYFDAGAWAFPLIALFIGLGALADAVVPGVLSGPPARAVLPFALLVLALRFTRRRWCMRACSRSAGSSTRR